VRQDKTLDVIDVPDAETVEFGLHHFKKLAMKTLNEKNCIEICLFHMTAHIS
jgi:hypothetical protein